MRRSLFALVAANAISQVGNIVALIALPWFVLVTTGSPVKTGITGFATTLPLALGAIIGGRIVDRIGIRRASIASDLAATLAIAAIPALHAAGALTFPLLVAFAFLASACEAPGRAARQALLPDLADRASVSRERANSVATTSEHTGYVLAAPLGGVLVASIGAPAALWVDAATFTTSAMLVALGVPTLRATIGRVRFVDGVHYVMRQPLLRTFFLIWTIGAFFIGPLASVILPVYAKRELGGAGDFGATVASYGVGGLVGAAAFAYIGSHIARRAFYVAMWVVYPVLSLALVPLPRLVPLLTLLFLIGFLAGTYNPFEVTVHQELVPVELRARVFAILIACEMIVVPPSMLVYGAVIGAAGLRAGILMFAVGNVLLSVFALVNKPARTL